MITALAERYGDDQVGVVLADTPIKAKLHLSLRFVKFETEMQRMSLPNDIKTLLEALLEEREKELEHKYQMVFIFSQLQQKGSFWQDFNYNSIDELLASLDLPNGKTLGMWEILVRLFDKETFMLVGDEALSYMTFQISQHQKNDVDQRKRDYQAIFDAYCASYTVFDKPTFYKTVNRYVNKHYVMKVVSKFDDKDIDKTPTKNEPPGVRRVRIIRPIKEGVAQSIEPRLKNDFAIETNQCKGCRERDTKLNELQEYSLALEQIIIEKIGESSLPSIGRPKFLP